MIHLNHIWLGIKPSYIHQFLKSNLQPDSVFIDCGANIGIWSLIAHETIQETGKVYSFEPNPILYKRLTKNLNFNNVCNNCICYPMGLSSKSYSAFLNLDDNHHQMGSLHTEQSDNKVKVELITLDSLKLPRIDGI